MLSECKTSRVTPAEDNAKSMLLNLLTGHAQTTHEGRFSSCRHWTQDFLRVKYLTIMLRAKQCNLPQVISS